MRRYLFAGGTAVVTGAANGIGAALAHGLAARGSGLVLVDRDAEGLAAVRAGVRAARPGWPVATYVEDLADGPATTALGKRIATEHPAARLLVNNAGVGLAGRFDQVDVEDVEWVLDVNLQAPIRLTHALLPTLKANPGSHVALLSSVLGLVGAYGQSAYCTSKFGLRGFGEVLRQELAEDGVGVTTVHPGGIRTGIARAARVGSGVTPEEYEEGMAEFERVLTIEPEDAARRILDGIERRRPRVLIGATATVPDAVARLLPTRYPGAVARLARSRGGAVRPR